MRYYIQDSSGRKYGVESNISSAKQRARILSGSKEKTLSVVDINNETTAKFRNGMQIRHNPHKARRNPSAFDDAYDVFDQLEGYYLDRSDDTGKRFPEEIKRIGHNLWVAQQAGDEKTAREIRIDVLRRLKELGMSDNPKRRTHRNSSESLPVKKSYWKWIAGAGVVLAALYIIRRRTQTAVLPQTFPTTPMAPVLSAPRVGQSFAQAAQIMRQSNTPYRIVRQDGKALATTKDFNSNRWNLEVNRGVIVRAYKG